MCSKYFDARLGMQVATPQQRFCQHFFPQSMLSKKLGFPLEGGGGGGATGGSVIGLADGQPTTGLQIRLLSQVI